jgi:hypothetical protein
VPSKPGIRFAAGHRGRAEAQSGAGPMQGYLQGENGMQQKRDHFACMKILAPVPAAAGGRAMAARPRTRLAERLLRAAQDRPVPAARTETT